MPKQKKELEVPDHTKIDYPPFRKEFYVEVPEIAKMQDHEVADLRHDRNIKVRGKDCPKPINNWAQCGVHPHVLNTCKKLGYLEPTPIQSQAIPVRHSPPDIPLLRRPVVPLLRPATTFRLQHSTPLILSSLPQPLTTTITIVIIATAATRHHR
jgi:hypothetical protein